MSHQSGWDWEIRSGTSWLGSGWQELLAYKDLLLRLVRKELLASYQQTLLGPFWILLPPLLSVGTYVLIFQQVMGFSTEGMPAFLFYLVGITLWNLFSDLFTHTTQSFVSNIGIYDKVYFPRLVLPLSLLLLNLIRFGIQMLLVVSVLLFYWLNGRVSLSVENLLLCVPVIFIISGIAFGAGLICSMASVKYRDLLGFSQLILRLLFFLCPVVYSHSVVPQKLKWVIGLNPLGPLFELFRYALLGKGMVSISSIGYSLGFMFLILAAGIMVFNKLCESLIDVA